MAKKKPTKKKKPAKKAEKLPTGAKGLLQVSEKSGRRVASVAVQMCDEGCCFRTEISHPEKGQLTPEDVLVSLGILQEVVKDRGLPNSPKPGLKATEDQRQTNAVVH